MVGERGAENYHFNYSMANPVSLSLTAEATTKELQGEGMLPLLMEILIPLPDLHAAPKES